jgi:hypothetical protein
MTDWYSMCNELTEHHLMTDAEANVALAASIRKKRPDRWALQWGRRLIRILDFTRCNDRDYRQDWHETTETYKTSRYQPLSDRMTEVLPRGWSVEIVNFTLGMPGLFAKTRWTASLMALGVSVAGVVHRMEALEAQCLIALRQKADAQG